MSEADPAGAVAGLTPTIRAIEGPAEHGLERVRTRYYEAGDPADPTLVLAHGSHLSGTANANLMASIVEGLSDAYHVVALDRLACGETDNPDPPDAENFVFRAEIEHLEAFIDQVVGPEAPFHIAGHSTGGGLAGVVATERPDRVETLTLLSSGSFAPDWFDNAYRQRQVRGDWDRFDAGDALGLTAADRYRYNLEKISYDTGHVTDELVAAAVHLDGLPKVDVTRANADEDRWRASKATEIRRAHERIRTGGFDAPTLLHWGANDPVTAPLESGQALYAVLSSRIDATRFVSFNRAGHLAYREHPAEFNRQLATFLEFWGGDG